MNANQQAGKLQKKCIFISHSSNEVSVAKLIKELVLSSFREAALEVFVAEEIEVGSRWLDEIVQQLTRADLIIGLFSPHSLVRPWVQIECGYAVITGKIILPLRFNGLKAEQLKSPYDYNKSVDVSTKAGALEMLESIREKLRLRESPKRTEKKRLDNWDSKFDLAIHRIDEGDESRRGARDFNWFFGLNDKTPKAHVWLQDTKGRDFRIRTHHDVGKRTYRKVFCGPKNHDNVVVFNDLEALNAVSRLFAIFNTDLAIFCDNPSNQQREATHLAIGLHNGVAHRICNRSNGLVELRLEGNISPGKRKKTKSAFPEFVVAEELFQHSTVDAKDVKQQKALILRVVDSVTGRVSFVLGGFDGQGTAAAGIFLGLHWREMAMQLRDNKCDESSLAVVIKFDRLNPLDGYSDWHKVVTAVNGRFEELPLSSKPPKPKPVASRTVRRRPAE